MVPDAVIAVQRRAQRVDSSRQLDLFSDLNLGPSDDEEGESEIVREGVASFACMVSSPNPPSLSEVSPLRSLLVPNDAGKTKKKGKKKKRPKAEGNNKPNKWADKCMYAELLEMRDGDVWDDGLPQDLENGWVAVAPVPVGKRCLAVTHQSSGVVGVGACVQAVDLYAIVETAFRSTQYLLTISSPG